MQHHHHLARAGFAPPIYQGPALVDTRVSVTLDSLMYLCSDVFHGLIVSRVVSLSSCTKCHVALIM
jgi:hypothetical protein